MPPTNLMDKSSETIMSTFNPETAFDIELNPVPWQGESAEFRGRLMTRHAPLLVMRELELRKRHPHDWRDVGGDLESHDRAGLFDSRRPRAAVLHGIGNLRLRCHSHVALSASHPRLRAGNAVLIETIEA